jgi:NAD(P)-dependent dehydrogenase (short-subunit alcohol dehydrogenase family)
MSTLAGRVALVTGGGRDVGAGISLALAEAGAAVGVNYHSSKDEAEAVVAQIVRAGGKAKAFKADIADFESVKGMVAAVKSEFASASLRPHRMNGAGRSIRVSMARSIAAMRPHRCSKLPARAGSFPSWETLPVSANPGWR